jgi:hypothetical protein
MDADQSQSVLDQLRGAPTADLVQAYLTLRDEKKRREDELARELERTKAMMGMIESTLLDRLSKNGASSERTPAGTAVRVHKVSTTIADPAVFRDFVIANGLYDLVDWRANSPTVQDYIKEAEVVPPGLNINSIYLVQVRKA